MYEAHPLDKKIRKILFRIFFDGSIRIQRTVPSSYTFFEDFFYCNKRQPHGHQLYKNKEKRSPQSAENNKFPSFSAHKGKNKGKNIKYAVLDDESPYKYRTLRGTVG